MPQAVSAGAHERLRQLQGWEVSRPAEKEMCGTPFGCCRLSIALSRLFLLKPAAWAAGLSEKVNKAFHLFCFFILTPCRAGQAAGSKPSLRCASQSRPPGTNFRSAMPHGVGHLGAATFARPPGRRRVRGAAL